MKVILLILISQLMFGQTGNEDCCRMVMPPDETWNYTWIDLRGRYIYLDSKSVLEVDSLYGSGAVLYGRWFPNDSVNEYVTADRWRQYRTPFKTADMPILRVRYISDSITVSTLVKIEQL